MEGLDRRVGLLDAGHRVRDEVVGLELAGLPPHGTRSAYTSLLNMGLFVSPESFFFASLCPLVPQPLCCPILVHACHLRCLFAFLCTRVCCRACSLSYALFLGKILRLASESSRRISIFRAYQAHSPCSGRRGSGRPSGSSSRLFCTTRPPASARVRTFVRFQTSIIAITHHHRRSTDLRSGKSARAVSRHRGVREDGGPKAVPIQRRPVTSWNGLRGPRRKNGTSFRGWQQQMVSRIGVSGHAPGGDLLAGGRDANHAAHAPTAVGALERRLRSGRECVAWPVSHRHSKAIDGSDKVSRGFRCSTTRFPMVNDKMGRRRN